MTRDHAHAYMAAYGAAIAVAVVVSLCYPREVRLFTRSYWRWLLAPWKVVSFVASAAVLVAAAPYAGDCDWNATISVLMSLLTFATAPWVVAELWQRRNLHALYVAVCAWLLSASWSLDLYWFWRRGFYTDGWLGNLVASSVLYLAAGVLWNLDWTPESGLTFAFREAQWPARRAPPPFKRLAVPVLAMMTVVGASLLLPFFVHRP